MKTYTNDELRIIFTSILARRTAAGCTTREKAEDSIVSFGILLDVIEKDQRLADELLEDGNRAIKEARGNN